MGEAERGGLCKASTARWPGCSMCPTAYAVAIEIALGGAMQNLVVDREEDGKAAIHCLKRRDGGRATFLPLNAIRPGGLPGHGGGAGAGLCGHGRRAGRL